MALNYSTEIVLDSLHQLEEIIQGKTHWNNIDLRSLLFEGCSNNSYQKLWFNEEVIDNALEEIRNDPNDLEYILEQVKKIAVYQFLKQEFPNRDYILVNVSW